MSRFQNSSRLLLVGAFGWLVMGGDSLATDYVVVVSKVTQNDGDWSKVIDKLVDKHQAEVGTYDKLGGES